MVTAVSPFGLLGGSGPSPVVMRPTFERYLVPSTKAALSGMGESGMTPEGWGSRTPSGDTPAQIRAAYGMSAIRFSSVVGDGTGQTIAIVDAFDDPDLVDSTAPGFLNSDLAKFDQEFGLPDPPSFIKLNEYGSASDLPGTDPAGAGNPQGNWEVEEALDVEWAHAIAPGAQIILIECNSDGGSDMFQGVTTAAGVPGVSVVSMSWGSAEFNGENFYDTDFTTPVGHQGVTFVASTGDQGSPGEYPAYSPNVLAVGGTTLDLNANGSYGSESAWSGSGGGTSVYETAPGYQVGAQSGAARTIPDVSSDADPDTGVPVYDSYNGTSAAPWEEVGGTSLAAPTWAGLIAIANQGRVASGSVTLNGSSQTLPAIYAIPSADFHDVTTGGNSGFNAGPGYDLVTGLGTPRANLLVPDLASYGLAAKLAVIAEPPSNVRAGASFALSVAVESASGGVEQNFSGSVTISLDSNVGGTALGGTLTVSAQNGVATFSGLTLTSAGTGYTLLATTGGVAVATNAFNVTPSVAAQLAVISEPPFRFGANQPFGLEVAVIDQFGNLESTFTGSVTVALASGPGGSTLSGTLTALVQNGVAVFTDLSLNRVGLGYSLKVVSHQALASTKTTLFGVVAERQTMNVEKLRLARNKASLMIHPRGRRPACGILKGCRVVDGRQRHCDPAKCRVPRRFGSRATQTDRDVNRLAIANDCDADQFTGPMLFDLGQKLFDRCARVCARRRRSRSADSWSIDLRTTPGASRSTRIANRLNARLLGRPSFHEAQHQQSFAGGVDPGDPQVSPNDSPVLRSTGRGFGRSS